MINLLPEQQKKVIMQEYKLRRLSLTFAFIIALALFADILLIPSLVIVYFRDRASDATLMTGKNSQDATERAALAKQLKDTKTLVEAAKPIPTKFTPTGILGIVLKDKTSDNVLTSLSYKPGDTGSFSVIVHGMAKNRESLMSFVSALKQEPGIKKVDLPISNFAQDTSINFDFTITGGPPS